MPDREIPINDISRAEAHARLAAIIESSDDAIVSKTLEGVIKTWNKGAERIFGWTAEEVIGKPITIIIPEDRQEEEPAILARMRRGERIDHFETIRQTKDGRLINVSVTISPVRDDNGKITGVSKVARDVTLQKQFQAQLQAAKAAADEARAVAEKAREAAEAANRSKDHFLSVLSHELRTPLTPVLAVISLIVQDKTVPAHIVEQLEIIRRNVETEARLVDDLLDLTRIARGKIRLHPEVVDVHAIIRSVVGMFDSEMDEKGLSLTMALRAKNSYIWADAGRFQQVLLNLLSNAIKFTPAEGAITIRTSNENGTIRIDVVDTGTGIEPDVLPRLFRPFEQGEQTITRRFGGLGLGLSIVKSLVELHKGSVSATSEGKNKGTTFSVRVDTVKPALRQQSEPVESSGGHLPNKGYRVLLVEDHQDTRNVLCKLLTRFGCTVTAASTVKEAIEASELEAFDLLISDIGLPDGSGIEIMRHMSRYNVIGIALSGFGQDEDVRRSREAGFTTHLTKPVNIRALQEVISNVAK